MSDMLSILIIVIVAYIAAKRLIVPRIVALRASKKGKNGTAHVIPVPADPCPASKENMQAVQTAIQTGGRSVTCLDVRFVNFNLPDDEEIGETLSMRVTHAANEMLLNASIRGTDVRFHVAVPHPDVLMLYVTYAVR